MSFTESSGTITQTGTDTNLSGLTGVTGVTVVDNGSHKTYHLDGKKLRIDGTLTIDPQVECLLFERQDLDIAGTLNFGVTAVIGGATRYSRAIGLISHDIGYARFLVLSGGTLNWNGGAMKLTGGCDFKDGSNVSITNGIIISTSTTSQRLRMNTANCSVDGLSIDGNARLDVMKKFVSFTGYECSFANFGTFQKVGTSHDGTDDPFVLTNFDAQGIDSANGSFIGSSFAGAKIEFVNMGYGGDFVISHDSWPAGAVTTLYKDVKLKIVDTNVANVAGAKYWARDTDNGSRTTQGVWRDSTLNPSENFSNDRTYTGSVDANGEATERLLTRACYGGTSSGGIYNGGTTIDYRGETTDNTDVFTFYVASYGHTLNSTSPSCIGKGVLTQQVVLFDDVFLTESTKSVVDAYTTIDNTQEFYDRAKSYLVDNYAGETSTIVTRSGNEIDLGSYNLVIDATASSAFALNGSTITIKATTFTGDLTTTGTITLSNGASVLGTYTDANGTNIILPWSVTNVEATATLQLYNVTKDLEIVNQVVPGTANTKVSTSGTYTTSQIASGDNIRLRITCQAEAAAFLPYESFGVASSAGISFRANQQPDTIYNNNGIDGSATTITSAFSADYTNLQIDSSETDGVVTVQEIYAFYVYSVTTSDGIDNFFGAITPIDSMNYRINTDVVDLKIQNTTSVDTILKGGRLYRDDNTSVIDTDSSTGAGTGSFTHDTGFLLQYLQPQVENAVDGAGLASGTDMTTVKSDVQSIKNNTSVIPGLL
jgi:hypothetical protein